MYGYRMYVKYWEKIMQGKRDNQITFSYKVCAIGILGIVCIVSALAINEWMTEPQPVEEVQSIDIWIPTEQDMLTIDSLYTIVKETEEDVEELNQSVDRIDNKLDDLIEERSEEEIIYE